MGSEVRTIHPMTAVVRSLEVICTDEMPLASYDNGNIYHSRTRLTVSAEEQNTKNRLVRNDTHCGTQFRSASSDSANAAIVPTAARPHQHRAVPVMLPNRLHDLDLGRM